MEKNFKIESKFKWNEYFSIDFMWTREKESKDENYYWKENIISKKNCAFSYYWNANYAIIEKQRRWITNLAVSNF